MVKLFLISSNKSDLLERDGNVVPPSFMFLKENTPLIALTWPTFYVCIKSSPSSPNLSFYAIFQLSYQIS